MVLIPGDRGVHNPEKEGADQIRSRWRPFFRGILSCAPMRRFNLTVLGLEWSLGMAKCGIGYSKSRMLIDAVWPLLKNLYLTLIFLIPIPLKAVVTPIKIAAVLSAHNTLS